MVELKGLNNYIFAVTGGMFLYIALVDMLPELNSTLEEVSKKSMKSSVHVFILQNIGILTGIFSLFVFSKYQHNIEIHIFIANYEMKDNIHDLHRKLSVAGQPLNIPK